MLSIQRKMLRYCLKYPIEDVDLIDYNQQKSIKILHFIVNRAAWLLARQGGGGGGGSCGTSHCVWGKTMNTILGGKSRENKEG